MQEKEDLMPFESPKIIQSLFVGEYENLLRRQQPQFNLTQISIEQTPI